MLASISLHCSGVNCDACKETYNTPRDLFPPEWEDHRDFEAGTVIDRWGSEAGSYTEMRVDDRHLEQCLFSNGASPSKLTDW